MGRIVITEFMSLDGVIEAPGGGETFKHGGWSFEISRGDEGDSDKKPLQLVDSKTVGDGVSILVYAPAA